MSRFPARDASEGLHAAMQRDPVVAGAALDVQRGPPKRDATPWHDELVALKARLAVQDLALRALVQSHPCPADVLDAWRQLRADQVVAAYAPNADDPSRDWLTSAAHALAEDWTSELADAAAGHPATQCADAIEPAAVANR